MAFQPVSSLADLNTLEKEDDLEGYRSAERGDPEPGDNRGRAFWHGWCNRMRDIGELPPCHHAASLAKECLEHIRASDAGIR